MGAERGGKRGREGERFEKEQSSHAQHLFIHTVHLLHELSLVNSATCPCMGTRIHTYTHTHIHTLIQTQKPAPHTHIYTTLTQDCVPATVYWRPVFESFLIWVCETTYVCFQVNTITWSQIHNRKIQVAVCSRRPRPPALASSVKLWHFLEQYTSSNSVFTFSAVS